MSTTHVDERMPPHLALHLQMERPPVPRRARRRIASSRERKDRSTEGGREDLGRLKAFFNWAIDAQRRESGEAAKSEQEPAEMQKNLQQGPRKGPQADKIVRQREAGNTV